MQSGATNIEHCWITDLGRDRQLDDPIGNPRCI
jgi:hypothetical protein